MTSPRLGKLTSMIFLLITGTLTPKVYLFTRIKSPTKSVGSIEPEGILKGSYKNERSKKTIKHVVDGQQRTMTLLAFAKNELRLSNALELDGAKGRLYDELDDDLKGLFLSYQLMFDQFEGATEDDVREYFRRINSFTAPLNSEEQRHAKYQGAMKWFVLRLAQAHGDELVNLNVLPEKAVIRMADAKLLAEIVHALINGVTTTSKTSLDRMYATYDKAQAIPYENDIATAISDAMNEILSIRELLGTAVLKMNVFYSLMLAMIAVRRNWPTLQYLRAGGSQMSRGSTAN